MDEHFAPKKKSKKNQKKKPTNKSPLELVSVGMYGNAVAGAVCNLEGCKSTVL